MTDVNEHLSTSSSSETDQVKDSGVDAVSRERVDSETELNCSIETCEGDESVDDDDDEKTETKKDVETEDEDSETDKEDETKTPDEPKAPGQPKAVHEPRTLDEPKAPGQLEAPGQPKAVHEPRTLDEPKAPGQLEAPGQPKAVHEPRTLDEPKAPGQLEAPGQPKAVHEPRTLDEPKAPGQPEAPGQPKAVHEPRTLDEPKAPEASLTEGSRSEEAHSNVRENAEENVSNSPGLSSKAEYKEVETSSNSPERGLKVEERRPEAEEHRSKVEENENESSLAQEECSKANEECSKVKEVCSKADITFPNADETCLEADEKCSDADKQLPKTDEESSEVDKESSKADEEFQKADEESSKAGGEVPEGEEKSFDANKELPKADEESSNADEELPKEDEKLLKSEKEFTKADVECLKDGKEVSTTGEELSTDVGEYTKAGEEFSKEIEEYTEAGEEFSKEVEEYSEANEEFSKEVEEFSMTDEEYSKTEAHNIEIKEETEAPISELPKESSHVDETSSEVTEEEEITDDEEEAIEEEDLNSEEHSSKMEEKPSNVEKNSSEADESTKREASNDHLEKNSNLKESISSAEVWEENSEAGEGEEDKEEEEEEGDTEQEDGSSQATGTEQEDSEDEEEEEEDGSEKDADSASGWDEKRHMGDGEEETEAKVEKKLDDDEDKANPAYIPRKGAFYEHDLRLDDVNDEEVKEDKEQNVSGKRLWVDDHKWEHDRYDARQQAPKSTQDLIDVYGFDIRRGKESDVPVCESMPRTRRPGDKNRFGDFIRRQVSDEQSGDDTESRDGHRTLSNRNRNRFNNENRRYQGRRGNTRNNEVSVGFAHSDFPALRENVDNVVKANNAVQPMKDNSRDERNAGNFRQRPDRHGSREDEDMEMHGRYQRDRRGGASERNDTDFRRRQERRGYVGEENEEDSDDRKGGWHERRGGPSRSRGAPRLNRGRGRGGRFGCGQRDRHEPDGRNRHWQEREETNEDNGYRESRISESSSIFEEIPRRTVGSRENRQRAESEASQSGDLGSRQKDFDGELSDHGSRGGRHVGSDGRETGGEQAWGYDRSRGRGRARGSRYEGKYNSPEQRSRRGQDHSYRGQRPRQEGDHRLRDRDHQESFPTRTIQNSNIPGGGGGRPFSDAKTREEEKQELLHSVSAEIKKMNVNEREMAARQQTSHVANERISDERQPGNYRQVPGSEQHRGTDGDTRTVHEKPHYHKDLSYVRTVPDDSNAEVRKRSTVIIQTTDTPEMLPPVTSIQTFSRPAERSAPEPRPPDRPANKGWAGGEFTPAWRVQPVPAMKAEPTLPVPSGKPKRYSTLRQKAAGADVVYAEPVNADYQGAIGPALQPLTAALPSRPLPAATYYDSSSSYVAAPSFHAPSGLTLGMQQMAAYQMQANVQHGLYNNHQYNMSSPQTVKPGTPVQHMYMPHSGSMLPGPYMSMMNYPSPFPMAPVQMAPNAQAAHMHAQMQDPEAVEMHRLMYYNQQGIPMSVMQQYVDQTAYINEQNQVDHNIGPESYSVAGELTSPNQGAHEY